MELVLDTNVWLDWLVFDDPGVSRLKRAVAAGSATVWTDEPCFAELGRVLGYPLRGEVLASDEQARHLGYARNIARRFDRSRAAVLPCCRLPRCRDPDDQKFLELARDCQAEALLTRDRALLELARRKRDPLPFRVLEPDALSL